MSDPTPTLQKSSSTTSTRGPHVVHSIAEGRERIREAREAGRRIGLVPTMGALHEGHLSLLDAARETCDFVVATIFVNPTQFAPHEDLAKYPRTFQEDLDRLTAKKVDLVFAPRDEEMYPQGFSTHVSPPSVAAPWEGLIRPGHFQGVATVVLKLFHILPADIAFFGQKDYQQTCVIRQMVADLNLAIDVRVCPTIRDHDGLALSSRNQYLSRDERSQAIGLYRSLQRGATLICEGETLPEKVEQQMRRVLEEHRIRDIEYIGIAHPETLEPQREICLPTVLLVAARLGSTRLIDNWLLADSPRAAPASPAAPRDGRSSRFI